MHFLFNMKKTRSFTSNMDEFLLCVNNFRVEIDVIVFTKTWFGDDTQDIPKYVGFLHTFRSNRAGGGVSVCA